VFGLLAGFVAFVYVFGGIVLLLRLQVRGLRADVVVSALPRNFLVSVGLAVLFQFVIFLALLMAALIQQAHRSTALTPVGRQAPWGLVIRYVIVSLATLVLAWPLSRWIGWEGVAWWWGLVLPYVLVIVAFLFFASRALWPETGNRWVVPLSITAAAGLAIGLLVVFEYHSEKPLMFLVVLFAAVLTAAALWFLLRRVVDEPAAPDVDRATLQRASLLALLACLIFLPWRAALEVASLQGLDVNVCTTNASPHKNSFEGLFIGESDNSIFVGEDKSSAVKHPRIVEIPRDKVMRVYLGKGARDVVCAEN
jgi:hypothetical protein